ncbi:hypothetical protein, partial [Neisseria sicca]|uniref:hypothetical protein n=1 Tax=Neisseria sicca TaxID=490 RepID=UPI003F68A921
IDISGDEMGVVQDHGRFGESDEVCLVGVWKVKGKKRWEGKEGWLWEEGVEQGKKEGVEVEKGGKVMGEGEKVWV